MRDFQNFITLIKGPEGYFASQTGSPKTDYRSFPSSQKQHWIESRRENFKKEILNFRKKYDEDNEVLLESHHDQFNETATFESVEMFVQEFEISKFSDDDKDFVADLSKFIKIKNCK